MIRFACIPRSLLALSLVIPVAACSDDDDGGNDEVGDGDGDTDSGDGDGDTGDGDGGPGDGDGEPSDTGDGDGDTGDGDGDTGDGDGDGDTGDGDGDTGDGDGDGDGDTGDGDEDTSTYTAVVMPGIPDRLTITRTNIDEPTCTRVILYKPGFDTFDITIPMGWAIEEAMMWKQGFCPMDNANPHAYPDGGTGTISFASYDALMTYPCSLNFDLEMDMNTDPPSWTTWNTQGVPVTGVNCG